MTSVIKAAVNEETQIMMRDDHFISEAAKAKRGSQLLIKSQVRIMTAAQEAVN
jgi:hypothetical protein